MQRTLSGLDLAPILPLWLIAALTILALLALTMAFLRRARGAWWRVLAFALLVAALLNPRMVEETRDVRPDIALLMVDRTDSAKIGNRAQVIDAARDRIQAQLGRFNDLQLQTVEVPEGGSQGTRLYGAMERALADIPYARLAGVIALSDGQAHDLPAAPRLDAPFHLLMPGKPGEVDRHLRVIEAPGFGIVGKSVTLRVAIEDLGAPLPQPGATARLTIRRDGQDRVESVPIGQEHRIEIPIERGGQTVVELQAETRPGEVSNINNRAVISINGVRDRLRVLLVSGEPHAGERTWRRLLKADPNVDLVHFTILRPPEKDDLTPLNELALIAFPVRELFQVKIKDFDLIVLDRFANRGILPPAYLRNIADYVRGGGALLVSVGPEFTGATSLASTPLGQVLPARPLPGSTAIAEGPFRPRVTAEGGRHPVTEGLTGANPTGPDAGNAEARWGRWYRMIHAEARSGTTAMEGPGGAPLLQLDRVGEGRVALLLSDQIWLWSRGHDGGGPQGELLRRAAHWLMKEPELEEEDLTARIENGQLTVTRQSLSAETPPEATITAPDGTETRRPLTLSGNGRATAQMPVNQPGVWRVTDGRRTAFAAAGAANPPEIADLRADPGRLAPLLQASGGAARWIGEEPGQIALPDIRRISAGRDMAGSSWIGLRRNQDHTVTGISATPLLPPWLALPLLLGVAILAWRREGR
ncbi:hypothetical protein IAI18_02800 [Acetobacteraceae bacterium H6797]|nr:hypothetical protein [Acetobacteraceae bacterium H6797]